MAKGDKYIALTAYLKKSGITIFQVIMDTARTRTPEMRNCTGAWI